ncbi:MAG: hypothetical protein PSV35_02140, partial [bacterium]|nr:hypothetical protein [bacterium]
VFKPHIIDIYGKKTHFIDGGLHRSLLTPNYQIPAFVTDKERRLNSILLLLYPEGEANSKLYGPVKQLNFIMVFIGYMIKLIFGANGVEAKFRMEQGVADYGQGVIPMNVDISPNNFGVSDETKKALGQKSIKSVQTYFNSFRNDASYYVDGVSISDCLYQVPSTQLNKANIQLEKNIQYDPQLVAEIIKHRTITQPEMIQSLQLLLKSSQPIDRDCLDKIIYDYCSPPLVVTGQEERELIYTTNMERLFNGLNYPLKDFFSQSTVSVDKEMVTNKDFYPEVTIIIDQGTPNINALKALYNQHINESNEFLRP